MDRGTRHRSRLLHLHLYYEWHDRLEHDDKLYVCRRHPARWRPQHCFPHLQIIKRIDITTHIIRTFEGETQQPGL